MIHDLAQGVGGGVGAIAWEDAVALEQFGAAASLDFGRDLAWANLVGEQAELLAQPQDRLFGPQRALQPVELRIAYRAEQHRIGSLGQRQRRFAEQAGRPSWREIASRTNISCS